MTVKELIEQLSALPADADVCVDGLNELNGFDTLEADEVRYISVESDEPEDRHFVMISNKKQAARLGERLVGAI